MLGEQCTSVCSIVVEKITLSVVETSVCSIITLCLIIPDPKTPHWYNVLPNLSKNLDLVGIPGGDVPVQAD
jgi:hypothetical protein